MALIYLPWVLGIEETTKADFILTTDNRSLSIDLRILTRFGVMQSYRLHR